MSFVRAILITARNLIVRPEHWTQDELARDANGRGVDPRSTHAVCFCDLGALSLARASICGGLSPEAQLEGSRARTALVGAMRQLDDYRPNGRIAEFNDRRPHDDQLRAFELAIVVHTPAYLLAPSSEAFFDAHGTWPTSSKALAGWMGDCLRDPSHAWHAVAAQFFSDPQI